MFAPSQNAQITTNIQVLPSIVHTDYQRQYSYLPALLTGRKKTKIIKNKSSPPKARAILR